LSDVLSRDKVRETAKEILFEGVDVGEEEEEGETIQLGYARSLPVEVALDADTILAYEMNGEPLQPAHGYPVRLIFPGWYAMASVKWLTRIEVLEEPYQGFFQKRRYVFINEGETERHSWQPVTALRVKSLISRPRHGEVVQPGPYTVSGTAWSGEGEIARIEVSTSGGRDWQEASLVGPSVHTAWRRWELPWNASRPGHYILMVRATDSAGNTQPADIGWNFRGYANNGIHTIAVEVPPR
jgi:DMSO/TMAO reductase YedYZ molybdopterin-dependent catalytic subunit